MSNTKPIKDETAGPLGFGPRLRRLRESRAVTQIALAHTLGCTGSAVSLWEHGDGYPSFWNLVEITKFFGVDMDWLTGMPYVRNELQQRTKIREQLKGAVTT